MGSNEQSQPRNKTIYPMNNLFKEVIVEDENEEGARDGGRNLSTGAFARVQGNSAANSMSSTLQKKKKQENLQHMLLESNYGH